MAAHCARLDLSRIFGTLPAAMIFFSAGLVEAQLIDVDFNNDSAGSAHGGPAVGPTMSGVAVLGAGGDQWNGINATNGSGISLIYANGGASNVKMTFTSGGGYDAKSYSGSTPFAGTPYNNLMEDYLFNGGTAQTITLSGLATNAAYNLVLYNAADTAAAGRTTYFTVNASTQGSTWNATSSTLISGVDYVQFPSATSDGSGNLAIVYIGNGSAEGDVDGFQIQANVAPTPTVAITSPLNNAVFASPANVTIAANATVNGGSVTNVQFFTNGVSVGSVTAAPFSITASNLTVGSYVLAAVATAGGISSTSSVITVSVITLQANNSSAYTWTTFAGHPPSGSADGVGGAAEFNDPANVTVDGATNVYVTDFGNAVIRKITPAGLVSTIAGLAGSYGSSDGTNSTAQFFYPWGIAADSAGNLYVSDRYYGTIRKITPVGTNWVVTTIAGSAGISGTADGTGSNARFNQPFGVAVDSATNIYVADTGNATIRKITPSGTNWVVTTIAGLGENYGSADGTGTNAQFFSPNSIVWVNTTNLYVTDGGNYTIRKMVLTGTNWAVTTIAGLAGNYGTNDGIGSAAQFNAPAGIAADNSGNLYVADSGNSTIRKLAPAGTNWVVSTFAGTIGSYGNADLTGTSASFHSPYGVAKDLGGNLYVADFGNNEIRKVTTVGAIVSTIAGSGGPGSANGIGSTARFNTPTGVTVDGSGNVYVADCVNDLIRVITSLGQVNTIAGSVTNAGSVDGAGSNARFNFPEGIAVDSTGNLYVTDSQTNRIREISGGVVSTIAVLGGQPWGIAIDGANNLYVTENYRNTIVKIAPVAGTTNWVVSTVAGLANVSGSQDGTNSAARFNIPDSIAVDSATNLYVADQNNHTIRKISPVGTNWVVTTIAGLATNSGSADGLGSSARFFQPSGITVDSATNLYVTSNASLIRKISPLGSAWVVSTIGGNGNTGTADGIGNAARFYFPEGITVDAQGNVYVADSVNNTIRKGVFSAFGAANPVPYTYPAMTGQLTVTLTPANASGQWRFPWEIGWRNSGTTVSNLVAGNYPVQFRALPGWLAVPSSLTVPVPNGGTIFVTNQYYPTISSVSTNSGGTLTVAFVSGNPTNAGWRFLGDTTPYYPAGSTNLVAGTYLIQFAPIAGRVTPPNLSIQVLAGQTTFLTENYLIAPANNNGIALPYPVPTTPTNEISDLSDYPFGFNGQLQSDVGYGSGVAVQTNVVLTAAHLVFSDDTLSYVSQAYWYFQQETGVFAPEPQAARGWYILSGYAAQRTYDLTMTTNYAPDQSSPQSRNFDVAVLYFLSPVAGGGYGGYLPSDASPNPWLTGTSLKMLVGYPVDGSEFGIGVTNGDMYQTQPQPYPLTISSDSVTNQQEVYIDPNFLGYPGNSGGPVYVQFNGYYYPAGVYLGTLYNGATPYASVVRAIDSAVVNLITNAAILGDSYTNHSGGGVITIIPSQAVSASNPGYLEFQLGPPAAVAAGAGWELAGDSSFSSATNYIRAVLSTNAFTVVFNPIPGWNVPTNQSVSVQPGQIAVYSALYTVANLLQIVSPQVSGGSFQLSFQSVNGQSYTLYYNNSLSTTNWLPYTNVTGNGNLMQLSVPVTNSTQRFFRVSQP